MEYQNLIVVATFILVYSLVSVCLQKTTFSGPFLAMFFGILTGPLLIHWLNIKVDMEVYSMIAELALALVLFTDASNTNLKVLETNVKLPARLLLIGLPLTIVFGVLAGFILFKGYSWIEVGILATILAPTDAALGKAVVTNPKVPLKIRESLNVESGLNDGVSVPVLFLLIVIYASESVSDVSVQSGIILFAREIGVGLLVGLSVTYLADRLIAYSIKQKWISQSWKPMVIISLAIVCFSAAQALGGSGFIACFTGGLLYGAVNKKYKNELLEAAEGAGDTLSLLTWIIFGALVVASNFQDFTWEIIVYALFSLTLIRMIPVFISLTGTKMPVKQILFMGWFGPRGLASIVFAIIILDMELPHQNTIILTVICTILFSIVLHGFTANPFINQLNKK